jgi:hypothetical protein
MPPRQLVHLLMGLVLVVGAGGLNAAVQPQIVRITPVREGDLLICRLATQGLPGEKVALSMQSGLVSSLELILELLDEKEHVRAGNRVTFHLAFDLWEEVFSVQQGSREQRFTDMDALTRFLSEMPRLPVAPLSALDSQDRFQIRAGLILHPIAPRERERVEDVIVGNARSGAAAGDEGREVSVGLGRLIRFFYKGGSRDSMTQSEMLSAWFCLEDLGDAPD